MGDLELEVFTVVEWKIKELRVLACAVNLQLFGTKKMGDANVALGSASNAFGRRMVREGGGELRAASSFIFEQVERTVIHPRISGYGGALNK